MVVIPNLGSPNPKTSAEVVAGGEQPTGYSHPATAPQGLERFSISIPTGLSSPLDPF